jgi:diaminopimelate epimerase
LHVHVLNSTLFLQQESASVDSSLGLRVFPRDFPETSACGTFSACHLFELLFGMFSRSFCR